MTTDARSLLSRPFALAAALGLSLATIVACSSSSSDTSSSSSGGTPDGSAADPDAAAGDNDGAATEDGASATDGASAAFALTSSALPEGATFPVDNTCTGTNVSPPLAWTGGPAGTKSYAIVLDDTTISFLHAIIYDIPASVNALPADVEQVYAPTTPAGAHQTKSYKGAFGYAGPCPGTLHVYEFVLYALDVAALPGVTQNVALADAETAIKAHSLASTKLTGKYKKP
jgi:Raf kinase inhibitor-like YbhB/YbcL family protein